MEGTYNINDLALMTGFTTRTLRTYLKEGLLKGEKVNGIWQFSAEEIDRFFREPFVKEGLRIKRSGQVFDFMADQPKAARSCVILDIPASVAKGNQISAFFCSEMCEASDAKFNYGWDNGLCRVILSGAADSVAAIMQKYYESGLAK
ncbi:MAG: MerR family transcriptional regulator [Lachnospiraceae bacterium]|nr:MerR family transcriptional regulator [Lachnospiraceae bacterium]